MKRKRWTILDVEELTIEFIRDYASKNGFTTGKALTELLKPKIKKTRQ